MQDIFKLNFGHAARNYHLHPLLTHTADLIEDLLFCCVLDRAGVAYIDLCLPGNSRAQ